MKLSFFSLSLGWAVFISCHGKISDRFDGQKAYQYLATQCQYGPRNPGSDGHRRTLAYLQSELRKSSSHLRLQDFTAANPLTGESLSFTNLLASFYPEEEERILLCAHWDTRPWADRDKDSSQHHTPIIGANDGASGVAVLLHLAEIIAQHKPKYGVDIALFDGEDLGTSGNPRSYALGSQYFARNLNNYHPDLAILLDMVGDQDLRIYKEEYSDRFAHQVVDHIWSRAKKLKLDCLVDSVGYSVWDDHVPLLEQGIPCANLIDFHYPWWHTTGDTPDKCSAQSLEKIGRLLVSLLYD